MNDSETIMNLSGLKPDPRNARKHNPRNVGMIERALGEVGAARSIVIDENGVVLAGNATVEAAAAAGIERVQVVDADGETIVAVRRAGLTQEQKTKLALYDNRTAELAEWDSETLAGIADEIDLANVFTNEELQDLLAPEADLYSRRIEAPIYEPSERKPAIAELYDDSRTQTLIALIDASPDVAEDVKAFLRLAAQRHTVLRFNLIADYYAHSPAAVQRLMEQSALVIIDFDNALADGFVRLTRQIMDQMRDEYGDDTDK